MQGYQLKVVIKGSKPPIWRRILVPDKISFRDLDDIIEEAFGWTHEHMFSFYFREADEDFQGAPLKAPGDTADVGIAGWLWEGCTFLYTYDFGDNWEHAITVEKVLPYDKRYPQVIKSKGPNMIEDCGGIWGFYDCIDEAEPFDMEAVNARFATWDLAEMAEGEVYEDVDEEEGWSILDDLDDLEDVWDVDVVEDGEFADGMGIREALVDGDDDGEPFEEDDAGEDDFLEKLESMGLDVEGIRGIFEEDEDDGFSEDDLEEYRRQFPRPSRLQDVYANYKKGELETIARANGLARHGSMKKAELVSWLSGRLLDGHVMADTFMYADREEIELFEEAIESDGIFASEDLIGSSLLLCTDGAFVGDAEFYRVPVDVEERYRAITTPEFLEKRNGRWTLGLCCDAALYLYGIIPVVELAEICGRYGIGVTDEKSLADYIESRIRSGGTTYALRDGYLMDDMLLESNMYRHVLKTQESFDYYIPEDKKEFLQYGELGCQEPDEDTQFFLDYLQKKCGLSETKSFVAFYTVQGALRMNTGSDGVFLALKTSGCKLKSEKNRREALRQADLLNWHVRHWDLKGHTPREIRGDGEKIVPIFGNTVKREEKKIYPNDPCPCGSGKKYKYCCGRK